MASTITQPQPIDEVRALLQDFQDGYTRRDLKTLNGFMELFSSDKDIEVIGSGALNPGKGEWCLGMDAIRKLVENDWKYWGNLILDVAQARIHTLVDNAWISTSGTVTYVIENEQFIRDTFKEVSEILNKKEGSEQQRLLQIQREIAEMLHETGQGDKYIWPVRFTAILVKQNGLWYFHQIHFSHSTSRLPDVRLPAK
jgi:hypothetical protein